MKNCPKCQASISDTAKFCVKCGTNIKNYEEENAQQEIFCGKCGTKFLGGTFCPECGADMSKYVTGVDELPTNVRCGENAFSETLPDQARKDEEQRKAEWQIGDNLIFGSYYSDNVFAKSPIKWIVLERSGNKALLISECGIDYKLYSLSKYNPKYNPEYKNTTWKTAPLRKWLNNEFLNTAFNSAERKRIQTTKVVTPNNAQYGTAGGKATADKIFLLSIDEAYRYFSSDSKRECKPTVYAISQGAGPNDGSCWWLRSPGYYRNIAALVDPDGGINVYGDDVNDAMHCVRPALWIKL